MDLDEPIPENIEKIREYERKGYYIILVTGRREDRQKYKTLKQLEEWGIPFNEIYFRKPFDMRKDYNHKLSVMKN